MKTSNVSKCWHKAHRELHTVMIEIIDLVAPGPSKTWEHKTPNKHQLSNRYYKANEKMLDVERRTARKHRAYCKGLDGDKYYRY